MAQIKNIKVGQVLYDKHKYTQGNTTMRAWGVWRVYVKEVDPEFQWIIASWNGNAPRKYYQNSVSRWKVKEPKE